MDKERAARRALDLLRSVSIMTHRAPTTLGFVAVVALVGAGCSLGGLLNSDQLPKDVSDPAITQTPAGARAAYNGTLAQFRDAFGGGFINSNGGSVSFVAMTGVLSDELMAESGISQLDRRSLPSTGDDAGPYASLQRTRGQAGQAIELLTRYLPDSLALRAHLYALEGYTEIFLAEFFCSGIPLSTVDYGGGFTARPGSTTEQVFTHATALFDTALALAGDDARILDLARVGRARALLGLGGDTAYAAAAATAAAVNDAFYYNVAYLAESEVNFAYAAGGVPSGWTFTVQDREGINGLDWWTSRDPRTAMHVDSSTGQIRLHPEKYALDGSSPIVLASGVEARLVEAEAALRKGDVPTWLHLLNVLRTDSTFEMQPTTDPNDDPTAVDTLWHKGTGGYMGLAPLSDPETATGRVDLLFRERAFWLFLTGHRQGDLRRLIRQYERSENELYPTGMYLGGTGTEQFYGHDVTAPAAEDNNPLYTGCFSRDA